MLKKGVMKNTKIVKVGFKASKIFLSYQNYRNFTDSIIPDYLSNIQNGKGRLLLTLQKYLVEYTKTFDKALYTFTIMPIM